MLSERRAGRPLRPGASDEGPPSARPRRPPLARPPSRGGAPRRRAAAGEAAALSCASAAGSSRCSRRRASEWERRARRGGAVAARAAMLGGERPFDFVPAPPAGLARGDGEVADDPRRQVPGGCAARGCPPIASSSRRAPAPRCTCAAAAHRRALEAAVRVGVLESAFERIQADLRASTLRRIAIERRWIPAHERALADLELGLDEVEREDGARVRRITGGGSGSRAARLG